MSDAVLLAKTVLKCRFVVADTDARKRAAALEFGGEKDFQRLARHLGADQALAERHDIGVIVLARQTRRGDIMDDGGAYLGVAPRHRQMATGSHWVVTKAAPP